MVEKRGNCGETSRFRHQTRIGKRRVDGDRNANGTGAGATAERGNEEGEDSHEEIDHVKLL
jgi:hypothetical protein